MKNKIIQLRDYAIKKEDTDLKILTSLLLEQYAHIDHIKSFIKNVAENSGLKLMYREIFEKELIDE